MGLKNIFDEIQNLNNLLIIDKQFIKEEYQNLQFNY